MATIQASAMRTPARSRAGQKRTWCPQGPGQPLLRSAVCAFLESSLHSVSILTPNTAGGVKLPAAGAVALPFRRGNRLWPSTPACTKIVLVVALPR